MECIEPNDCEHFRTVCVSLEVITEGMVRFLLMFQDCLKALLGNVAVAVLILFRFLSNGWWFLVARILMRSRPFWGPGWPGLDFQ